MLYRAFRFRLEDTILHDLFALSFWRIIFSVDTKFIRYMNGSEQDYGNHSLAVIHQFIFITPPLFKLVVQLLLYILGCHVCNIPHVPLFSVASWYKLPVCKKNTIETSMCLAFALKMTGHTKNSRMKQIWTFKYYFHINEHNKNFE